MSIFWTAVAVFGGLLLVGYGEATKCPDIPNFYKDINCTLEKTGPDGCPLRFKCPLSGYSNETDQCQYHGRLYNDKEPVDAKDAPDCSAACFCANTGNNMEFRCASVECGEFFDPPSAECVKQIKPNKCCAHTILCDPAEVKNLPTCHLDGREYRLEEEMYPDSESCHKCFCTKDFDNSTILDNPNCVEINCASEIHYLRRIRAGCIPKYHGDAKCCPSYDWRCPSDNDGVKKAENRATAIDENDVCKFGNLTLELGDKLIPEEECVSCICDMPPIPTCIHKRNCR